jgi:hypothetical protein
MNKIHKPPQLDEILYGNLHQLTKEFGIAHIFYHPATSTTVTEIVIVVIENKNVEIIESRKWIRNSLQTHGILFHVFNMYTMEYFYKKGNPFIANYCNQKLLIYQCFEVSERIIPDWKSFKKRYRKYEDQFHHDRDIFVSEINRYKKVSGFTSIFLTYESLFTHDIEFLESIYFGKIHSSENLHQRIKQLSSVIPYLESLFVKENETQYFLILQIEKGKIAADHDDSIYVKPELVNNIENTEQKLCDIICSRLLELKELIKSEDQPNFEWTISSTHEESDLSKIITRIISIKAVEEIYLIQKKEDINGFTYYLLLIGPGLGTKILNQIQESIAVSFDKSFVVLIGHSRIWIQKDIHVHQVFFQNIMTIENKIYQSHEFHPQIHCEDPYTPYFPDLDFTYASAKMLVDNYFILRSNVQNENHQGLLDLFSNSINRILHTIVYSKLSYRPHYICTESMWKLCLLAEPKLQNIQYLFGKISHENFFKIIDKHINYHLGFCKVSKEDLLVMDEILTVLISKTTDMVKSIDEKFVEWN